MRDVPGLVKCEARIFHTSQCPIQPITKVKYYIAEGRLLIIHVLVRPKCSHKKWNTNDSYIVYFRTLRKDGKIYIPLIN